MEKTDPEHERKEAGWSSFFTMLRTKAMSRGKNIIEEHIANQRMDFHDKVSDILTRQYDTIITEDLRLTRLGYPSFKHRI